MGTKNSKLNYDITVKLSQDHKANRYSKKLLILGPPKAGKSTLFHRLKLMHGHGFTYNERLQIKSQIYKYIISNMQNILQYIIQYKHQFQSNTIIAKYSQIILNIDLNDYEDIQSLNINHDLDIMTYIDILSKQTCVQQIIRNPSKYYIDDSIAYFLNHHTMQRMCDYIHYLPNDQDIISYRHRKGNYNLSEATINVRKDKFVIYDINYSKQNTNSCSKWMHCFENVTALIFVTSLTSYSETIIDEEKTYQDTLKMRIAMDGLIDLVGIDIVDLLMTFIVDPAFGKNAMMESIKLFHHIANNKWFSDTPIILMLNKRDILLNRIQKDDEMYAFIQCFPQFNQLVAYKQCMEFIRDEFCKQNNNPDRHIYAHFTSTTNDNNLVERLFNDVQGIVLEHCLRMGNHI